LNTLTPSNLQRRQYEQYTEAHASGNKCLQAINFRISTICSLLFMNTSTPSYALLLQLAKGTQTSKGPLKRELTLQASFFTELRRNFFYMFCTFEVIKSTSFHICKCLYMYLLPHHLLFRSQKSPITLPIYPRPTKCQQVAEPCSTTSVTDCK
jgi:hypothetical protein